VLGQYALRDLLNDSKTIDRTVQPWKPLLVCALPERGTPDDLFIRESLETVGVEMGWCFCRPGRKIAPSSYIVRSKESGSRTIVNYSEIEDITVEEFKGVFDAVGGMVKWWHFEVCSFCFSYFSLIPSLKNFLLCCE
jgi:hypothetical protein